MNLFLPEAVLFSKTYATKMKFSTLIFTSVLLHNRNLVSSRYPPQFLNNQSDRSSIVKRDDQKSVALLPVVTTS